MQKVNGTKKGFKTGLNQDGEPGEKKNKKKKLMMWNQITSKSVIKMVQDSTEHQSHLLDKLS